MKSLLKLTLAALATTVVFSTVSNAADYRIGLITPPSHQWSVQAVEMAKTLNEKTDGRVNLLVFPSGQLGSEAQVLQQMQAGAVDFSFMTLGEFANRNANFGIFLAPYLVKDIDGAQALLKGPTALKLLEEVKPLGLVGFGYGMAGMRQIVMRGDVKDGADLSGKKIRTIPLAPELDFWKKLGAAPTPMPLPALYDAFANGQVDGMQIDFEGTWNSSYYEHAGTILDSNHMMFPMVAVGSARKWATISPEDQEILRSTMVEYLDKIVSSYDQIDNDYLEKLKGTKVQVKSVDRSFFGAPIEDWYKEWREKTPLLKELEAEAAAL